MTNIKGDSTIYQLLVRPLCRLPLKALHKNVEMNPWEFHNALTFFRFINVPQRTRKTSSVTLWICYLASTRGSLCRSCRPRSLWRPLMMEDGVVETIPAGVIGVVFVSSSEASQNRKKNHGTKGDCGIGHKQVEKMDIEIHPWAVSSINSIYINFRTDLFFKPSNRAYWDEKQSNLMNRF